MLLLDAFRVHALHNPGNVVVVEPRSGEEFVYRQIWNASELLGAHLIEQTADGVLAAGEPVAVVGWDEPLVLACIIACAKSRHPHYFVMENMQLSASSTVALAASSALVERAKQLFGASTRVFDAQLMLSYIVPGMTDDFSCGCGAEDCAHGPFLQECMPSEWFASDGIFALSSPSATKVQIDACFGASGTPADACSMQACTSDKQAEVPAWQMTVAEHDMALTEALMTAGDTSAARHLSGKINRLDGAQLHSIPLNLCIPHLAAILATGEQIPVKIG